MKRILKMVNLVILKLSRGQAIKGNQALILKSKHTDKSKNVKAMFNLQIR